VPTPPRPDETQQDFISRCMKHLATKEGKTGEQAAGQCYSMWRHSKNVNKKVVSKIKRKGR